MARTRHNDTCDGWGEQEVRQRRGEDATREQEEERVEVGSEASSTRLVTGTKCRDQITFPIHVSTSQSMRAGCSRESLRGGEGDHKLVNSLWGHLPCGRLHEGKLTVVVPTPGAVLPYHHMAVCRRLLSPPPNSLSAGGAHCTSRCPPPTPLSLQKHKRNQNSKRENPLPPAMAA